MAVMLFFCKCALCYELSVLNPSQSVSNKCGQRRTTVLASTPELRFNLGTRNGRDKYLDTGVEISFMKTIE
jgi:hypothetical protein